MKGLRNHPTVRRYLAALRALASQRKPEDKQYLREQTVMLLIGSIVLTTLTILGMWWEGRL